MLKLSDSLRFMKTRGLNVANFYECKSKTELLSAYDRMEKPVVLKVNDEELSHKTDVGGIILNITDKKELIKNYNELKKISKSFVLQEQKKGLELIIGIINDSVFGKIIMVGIGGVLVELIKDVSFRKIPVSASDAKSMINELKFKKMLEGFRNSNTINKNKLIELITKLSSIAVKENIVELDLNPIMFLEDNYYIVDSRIELK